MLMCVMAMMAHNHQARSTMKSYTTFRALNLIIAGLALLLSACRSESHPHPITMAEIVDTAAADLCERQIVLLGEQGDHGGGKTIEIKALLTQRLIEDCGFNTVLFESGLYDFAKIHMNVAAGEPTTLAQVSSSIGGIWKDYAEMSVLMAFLTEATNSDHVIVGGVDFQLGSAGAFYSITSMAEELAGFLDTETAAPCQDHIQRLIYWSYGREGPSETDLQAIVQCSDNMLSAISGSALPDLEQSRWTQLVANVRAYAAIQGSPLQHKLQAREQAMYENFQWWTNSQPSSKVIIWGSSVHVAKNADSHPRFTGIETFGSRIAHQYGEDAYFVNFVSLSGSYKFRSQPEGIIETPEPGTLEHLFLGTQGYRYLTRRDVEMLGTKPATIYGRAPYLTDIAGVTDSLIIIENEQPPVFIP